MFDSVCKQCQLGEHELCCDELLDTTRTTDPHNHTHYTPICGCFVENHAPVLLKEDLLAGAA